MGKRPRRRRGVTTLDGYAEGLAALPGREALVLFDLRGLIGQLVVFDYRAEPVGEIAIAQVIQPGIVVHAVGQLHEDVEVLRAQLEFAFGSAEIEAEIRPQLALGVFAVMSLALAFGRFAAKLERRFGRSAEPGDGLARLQFDRRERWRRLTYRLTEVGQRALRRLADGDDQIDHRQSGGRDALRVDCDHQRPGHDLRHGQLRRVPRRMQQVMRFAQDYSALECRVIAFGVNNAKLIAFFGQALEKAAGQSRFPDA